jgi:tetratricopeptide (TPR) repeat protein
MSKCTKFLAVFFLFPALCLFAIDSDPDSYGSISDYLNEIYGIDENAGLTAFPILNIPMGGGSEGMAGAFSSVADDVSFIEWNPAGSSTLERSELAFFHNNWIADTKIESLAYAGRSGNWGFGASAKWLYLPFTQYSYFGERLSKGYYSEGVASLNGSINLFPGYYFGGISLGVNAKGAFRVVPNYANSAGVVQSNSGKSQSAASFLGDIGLLSRINFLKFYESRDRNMAFALVLRNVGMEAIDDPLPTVAVAGISYKPVRPLLLSFDYSMPLNLKNIDLSEKPYWAAGISVAVAQFLSMRAGLLMKSGNIRATVGSAVNLRNITFDINYTLDLLTQLQPLNRVAVGVRFNLGDNGRLARNKLVDKYYLAGLDAYSRGDDEEARKWFNEALTLNPFFDPAREGLAAINEYATLLDRIEKMQNIEY